MYYLTAEPELWICMLFMKSYRTILIKNHPSKNVSMTADMNDVKISGLNQVGADISLSGVR